MENNDKMLSVKNIVRIASLIGILFFFIPTFVVSCEGQDLRLSALNCTTGIKSQGYQVIEGNGICIIFLGIPIALLYVWFSKKRYDEKKKAILTTSFAGLEIVSWLFFSLRVSQTAKENYCESRTTFAFWINLLLWIIVLVLGILMLNNKISSDDDINDIKRLTDNISNKKGNSRKT